MASGVLAVLGGATAGLALLIAVAWRSYQAGKRYYGDGRHD